MGLPDLTADSLILESELYGEEGILRNMSDKITSDKYTHKLFIYSINNKEKRLVYLTEYI
jgi:hypothetical protein